MKINNNLNHRSGAVASAWSLEETLLLSVLQLKFGKFSKGVRTVWRGHNYLG